MASLYLDTSALARILLEEPGAAEVRGALEGFERRVASRLLRVELLRVAGRRSAYGRAELLLLGVSLQPLDDEVLTLVETVGPSTVATLDAIHLATAVRLARDGNLDALMTYDERLADGARQHGIKVLGP